MILLMLICFVCFNVHKFMFFSSWILHTLINYKKYCQVIVNGQNRHTLFNYKILLNKWHTLHIIFKPLKLVPRKMTYITYYPKLHNNDNILPLKQI